MITLKRQGVKADESNKQRRKEESLKMGSHINNPQSKRKEESSQGPLNEIEATKLSNIDFKMMVIKTFKELSENFKEHQGTFKELTVDYFSMRKGHRHYQ